MNTAKLTLARALAKRAMVPAGEIPAPGYYTPEEAVTLAAFDAISRATKPTRQTVASEVAAAIREAGVPEDSIPALSAIAMAEIGPSLAQFDRALLRAKVAALWAGMKSASMESAATTGATLLAKVAGKGYGARVALRKAKAVYRTAKAEAKAEAEGLDTASLAALIKAVKKEE